jgi:predicted transcriptional regulator
MVQWASSPNPPEESPADISSTITVDVVDNVKARIPVDVTEHTVKISNIPSVSNELEAVAPDTTILRAQSLMESKSYSQLAVMSGRDLKGAISWESIARRRLYGGSIEFVREAMDTNPIVVDRSSPLLEHATTIASAGFVFVRDEHKRVCGIVTAADLSFQFVQMANPFLLVGEIERLLRTVIDEEMSGDDLAAYANPDDPDRQIEGASDLTFGAYVRIFQNPDSWKRFGFAADRQVFCDHLERIRLLRNEIMHFNPDPITGEELEDMLRLLGWLKRLIDSSRSV